MSGESLQPEELGGPDDREGIVGVGVVGVVGLGLVGSALTTRLLGAGWPLLGWDHDARATAAWQAQTGAPAAASLAELAQRCAVVVLAVFDTGGVMQVVETLLDAHHPARPGTLIDCSTGDPEALATLAESLSARGLVFIEAPLSGSSAQIAAGQATMLLGAGDEALARHAALLQVLSPQRVHVGGPGMGARAKLATNLVLGLNRAALAEGLVFARRLGISPERFLELVLATPARSEAALQKGPRMVAGLRTEDFGQPQSRVHQHLKDLELMLTAAAATGQRLPFTTTHAALLRAAVAAGDGELDNTAIVRQLQRESDGGPAC